MLVVCRETLGLVPWRVAPSVEALRLGQQNAEDGLEEGRVELQGDVYEGIRAVLRRR